LSQGRLADPPSLVDKQLAAVFRKRGEMGIEFVNVLVGGVRLFGVALKIEGSPIPVGIVIDDVAELVEKKIGWLGAPGETGPPEFRSWLEAREQNFAACSGRRTDHGLSSLNLARRQAFCIIFTFAREGFEIIVTGLWVFDQAVL